MSNDVTREDYGIASADYGDDASRYGDGASRLGAQIVDPLRAAATSDVAATPATPAPSCPNSERFLADSSFFIPEVSTILHNLGWMVAEDFQGAWLRGQARELAGEQTSGLDAQGLPLDIVYVSMDWVLTFERCKEIYDEMIKPDVCLNEAGRTFLTAKVRARLDKNINAQELQFGEFNPSNTRALEDEYCNSRPLGYGAGLVSAPLDDFFGAIARCRFFAIPKGTATQRDSDVAVKVDEIGVYIRDSFSFNDDQILGAFKKPNEVKKWPLTADSLSFPRCSDRWFVLENADYRKFRNRTGLGRDFMIYSDVKSKAIDPFTFTFTLAPDRAVRRPSPRF